MTHMIRHYHDIRPADVSDGLGAPRMGIAVPIQTWSGITGIDDGEDDPSFTIFEATRTTHLAETYDEEPCLLSHRLDSIARREAPPSTRQSRSLTRPIRTANDWAAFTQNSLITPSPPRLPDVSCRIVDTIIRDGELVPVFDGRPLADLGDPQPVSLSWEDFLSTHLT